MKIHRNTIWLIPLLVVVTFPIWSIPVSDFLAPRGDFDKKLKNSTIDVNKFSMETVKILQHQNGKKTAIIRADRARTGKSLTVYFMENVDADIYDNENNITKIIAKEGQFNTFNEVLTLINDVVVNKIKDKQVLYTDLLHYDSKQRTVNCPEKTKMVSEDVTIDGGSFDYDINLGSYVVDKGVTCIINGFTKP